MAVRSGADAWLTAAGLLLVAVAGSLVVAIVNGAWFDGLNGQLGLTEPLPRALLFSSFLLVIGGAIVLRSPAAHGFRLGSTRRHLGLVAASLGAGATLTVLALRISGSTPYSSASWLVEVVVVPFTEELVFRAVLLTLLISAARRLRFGPRAVAVAVVADAVAFGAAHSANALSLDPSFVTMQVVFASILGVGCAALMARTRSVYPAMLLHAVVNATVVFGS